jgi:hypothetical protein
MRGVVQGSPGRVAHGKLNASRSLAVQRWVATRVPDRRVLTLHDYQSLLAHAREIALTVAPQVRLEPVGSFATGRLVPGYSDLDLLVSTASGEGPAARDIVPVLAERVGDLLTLFVDPFSSIGTLCSIYPGPLKVDWFICEEDAGTRTWVFSGTKPPPYDPDSHPWDWIWWLWGKIRRGDCQLGRTELTKLWQFLVLRGASPDQFPKVLPAAEQSQLEALVLSTLDCLPTSPRRLAREISDAIRAAA